MSSKLSTTTWLICLLILFGPPTLAAESFEVKTGQRQLFLDDVGIEKTTLKSTMHQPVKRGAVVRHPDPHKTLQTRTAPLWDRQDKLFKLWMASSGFGLYGTSPDGLHWDTEPYSGPNLVVIDPHETDPSRRFKAVLGGVSAVLGTDVGFAVSPDGKNWTKLDLPAIPSADEYNFSYNPKQRLFIHTVKREGPHGRAVAVATSTDFQNWTDHGLIFHADDEDQKLGIQRIKDRLKNPALKQTEYDVPSTYSIQIYNMGMFLYEGIFIGLPSVYHQTGKVPPGWPGFAKLNLSPEMVNATSFYGDHTGFYTIQLVSSRDMKSWKRHGGRTPWIEASPLGGGAYDLQAIYGPSEPLDRGEELWFYYTGIKQYAFVSSGTRPGYDDYVPDAGAICLAVLRKDGFVSLDADGNGGNLTTKPFKLPAGKLHVNVTCGKNGQLKVQVVDISGKVLATSAPISGEQLNGELEWTKGDLAAAAGKEVRLRFNLHSAEFYSYWFE